MSDREQWRFQWPDGTWIRWNPQTQSWEKEDQGGSAAAETTPTPTGREIPRPPTPSSGTAGGTGSSGWQPVAAQAPAPAAPPVEEETPAPHEPTSAVDLPEAVAEPDSPPEARPEPEARTERETQEHPVPAQETRPRAPRSSARDVLPPQQEPDRPGGSLLPTVIAGAVVGLGVGLLLSVVIR